MNKAKAIVPIACLLLLTLIDYAQTADLNSEQNKDKEEFLKSERDYHTEQSSAPYIVLFNLKAAPEVNGRELCIESSYLGWVLDRCNLKSDAIYFDNRQRAFIITEDTCFINAFRDSQPNLTLVDSIQTVIIPQIAQALKDELKQNNSKTFLNLYEIYEDSFLHALLRSGAKIYREDLSGYPRLYEF